MFKVVLKNVGRDMVNKDFTVEGSDINVALVEVFDVCLGILGTDRPFLFNVVGEDININIGSDIVGSISVTKLH